jgi:hypothetical protein
MAPCTTNIDGAAMPHISRFFGIVIAMDHAVAEGKEPNRIEPLE